MSPVSPSSGRRNYTITLAPDIYGWCTIHGHAKKSDPAAGRFNLSREFEDLVRVQLMPQVSKESVGRSLLREKDEIENERLHRLQELDRRARRALGMTLDEYASLEENRQLTIQQQADEARQVRKSVNDEIWSRLLGAWKKYTSNGGIRPRHQQIAWLKSHKDELKTLDLTAEAFLAKVEKGADS